MFFNEESDIPLNQVSLKGELVLPENAGTIVVFSHGSGSSRFSHRNQMVSKYLHNKGFGTLLFDLLTETEDQQHFNRFNLDLLSGRLIGATEWLRSLPAAQGRTICYFGAGTGVAASIKAATKLSFIRAIVSRSGRPDLAMKELSELRAPILLIVGGADQDVIELNRKAYLQLNCKKEMIIIPGATHFFDEPGAMDKVSEFAASWFEEYGLVMSGRH